MLWFVSIYTFFNYIIWLYSMHIYYINYLYFLYSSQIHFLKIKVCSVRKPFPMYQKKKLFPTFFAHGLGECTILPRLIYSPPVYPSRHLLIFFLKFLLTITAFVFMLFWLTSSLSCCMATCVFVFSRSKCISLSCLVRNASHITRMSHTHTYEKKQLILRYIYI